MKEASPLRLALKTKTLMRLALSLLFLSAWACETSEPLETDKDIGVRDIGLRDAANRDSNLEGGAVDTGIDPPRCPEQEVPLPPASILGRCTETFRACYGNAENETEEQDCLDANPSSNTACLACSNQYRFACATGATNNRACAELSGCLNACIQANCQTAACAQTAIEGSGVCVGDYQAFLDCVAESTDEGAACEEVGLREGSGNGACAN